MSKTPLEKFHEDCAAIGERITKLETDRAELLTMLAHALGALSFHTKRSGNYAADVRLIEDIRALLARMGEE